MSLKIETEAAQFPEKKYIHRNFVAVYNWKILRLFYKFITYRQ